MRRKVAEIVLEIDPGNKQALVIARELEEQLNRNTKATTAEKAEDST